METLFFISCIMIILLILYFKAKKYETEIANLEKKAKEIKRRKGLVLGNLPIIIYSCAYDKSWTMKYLSDGCYKLTGYYSEQFLDNNELEFKSIIVDKYVDYLDAKWEEAIKTKGVLREEYEIITVSGEKKWVWENGQAKYDSSGNVVALEGIIVDITDRKKNEFKLKYLTEHNYLTGVSNLVNFEQFYNKEKLSEKTKAIMMINIHKFNVINKIFGYKHADELIKSIAQGLLELENDNFKLFHIGIDKFIFYINDYNNRDELIDIYVKIITNIKLNIMEKTLYFKIGIMEINKNSFNNTEELLKNLSIATENANMVERFNYCFFDEEIKKSIDREIKIKQALEKTVCDNDDENLFIMYQPIIDIKKNKVYGFEALARYNHDEMGYVPPDEFISIAEEYQLIYQVGLKVMELSFEFANKIVEEGYENVTISFNVSAAQLLVDDFLNDIKRALYKTGANPRNLNMELTETVYVDNYQEINKKLNEIKELGIRVAIDDFGTGYSSLAREEVLNVDCIKIDKYFSDNLSIENIDKSIISDIISMARKKGQYVIAEGVEHEYQKNYLIENNCDMIQGYYFSKPISEDLAIEMLANSKVFFDF